MYAAFTTTQKPINEFTQAESALPGKTQDAPLIATAELRKHDQTVEGNLEGFPSTLSEAVKSNQSNSTEEGPAPTGRISIQQLRTLIQQNKRAVITAELQRKLRTLTEKQEDLMLTCLVMDEEEHWLDTPSEEFLLSLIRSYSRGALNKSDIERELEEFNLNFSEAIEYGRKALLDYPDHFRDLLCQ